MEPRKKPDESEQMAEYDRNAEDADPNVVSAIRECIGLGVGPDQTNYSHLSRVILSGGGYIVGMISMVMASPVASFAGACLAFASIVVFFSRVYLIIQDRGLLKGLWFKRWRVSGIVLRRKVLLIDFFYKIEKSPHFF